MEPESIDLRPQRPSNEQPRYEPTPAEIAQACAEIQREWSPEEERRRRVIPFEPARLPYVTMQQSEAEL